MFGYAGVYCLGIGSIWCIRNFGNKSYWDCCVTIFFYLLWTFLHRFYTFALHLYLRIWPSNMRTRGLSKGLLFTQLAIFFNIFVNPIFLKSIKWRYRFLQMGLLFCRSLYGLYFLPRDKGHSLEEMSMMFEGSNNAVMVDSSVVYSIVRGNTTRINDHE